MKLGLHYWNFAKPTQPAAIASTLRQTAQIAEQAGVSSFTFMDHYFQMEGAAPAEDPMLEGYTALGYVAALTERMDLGLLVTGRHVPASGPASPRLSPRWTYSSGGRARLGIGASWYEQEQRGLGVPVVPVAERFERLEETLQICLADVERQQRLLPGQALPAGGNPVRTGAGPSPRPPILIGGGGEQKTLRLVARYGDLCNVFGTSPDDVAYSSTSCVDTAKPRTRLRQHRQDGLGAQARVGGPLEAFLADVRGYAALGAVEVQTMPDRDPVEYATALAERVLPAVADIEPSTSVSAPIPRPASEPTTATTG